MKSTYLRAIAAAIALPILLFAFPVLAQSTLSDSPILKKLKRGEPVVLGYRSNSPPLSFANAGVADGYTVDICRAAIARLAKQLQRKDIAIEYKAVTLENRLTHVARGEIDMECGLTTNTTSRARVVDFSPTVLVTGTKFVVIASSSVQLPQELSGRTVSVGRGSTNAKSARRFASERSITIRLQETSDTKTAFTDVITGKSEAAALNEISARGWSREETRVAVRLLDRYLSTEPVAIALPKQDPVFTAAMSAAVSEVLISGEGERIYERWLGRFGLGLPLNQYTREAYRLPIAFSIADELL
jgi:ABC-type amino acid transport substrate-binding protein